MSATILCLEFWCNDEDDSWSATDRALVDRATQELLETGLVGHATVAEGHVVRVPRCYPVYARGYRDHLRLIADYLSGIQGLTVIGRYGAFKYNNQDHSILMGMLAAENITLGTTHNLWAINEGDEYYEHGALFDDVDHSQPWAR